MERRIRAVLFDLDDTLYDCTGMLVEAARRRAASALVAAGLPCTEDEAYELQIHYQEEYGPRANVFEKIIERYKMDLSLVDKVLEAYNSDEVMGIEPFPDVIPTLTSLRDEGYKLALITTGVHRRQERKIELLGIRDFFDHIEVNDSERGLLRGDAFQHVLDELNVRGDQAITVGDRIHSEIRLAKSYGTMTVQMLHGRFKKLIPDREEERPDFRIYRISELPTVLQLAERQQVAGQPNIVVIGGGTGMPVVLTGLRRFTRNLTAIVTVTDSGRSSGKLRNELGILPPGDIRNCLVALSESDQLLNDLFQYRFANGTLEGMSFGNLLLAAMAKVTGNFEKGLREVSRILNISGRVIPATLTDTHICARLVDGRIIEEEFNVREVGKAPIEEVYLQNDQVEPCEDALAEIARADLIVMGPGSLFTSIISNLLVPRISEAIRASRAKKVYVSNIVTQPGQTDGFTAIDHIEAVEKYLGEGELDEFIVNNFTPPDHIMEAYRAEGAELVLPDEKVRARQKPKIVEDNLIENLSERRRLWEKQDLLRHDTNRLAFHLIRTLYSG